MALVNELKKLARAANVQQSIIFDRSEASKYDTTKFVEIGQKGLIFKLLHFWKIETVFESRLI